jgi:hypothetical protein
MRKIWLGLILAGAVTVSAVGAWAAESGRRQIEVEYSGITVTVNGQKVAAGDVEPFIYVEKGRTFVPARPLAEALGAKVDWDGATSTVIVYSKDYVSNATEGDRKVWTMPAQGFRIATPTGYYQQDLGLFTLTLGKVSSLTGAPSFAGVKRYDFGADMSPAAKAEIMLRSLRSTVLPEAAATGAVEDAGQITVTGTAQLFGTTAVNFTLRIIPAAGGDWVLMTVGPTGAESELAGILASFAQL